MEKLPCLETLVLFANPVTGIVDYRTKILKLFGDRVAEITLDGQPASNQEMVSELKVCDEVLNNLC